MGLVSDSSWRADTGSRFETEQHPDNMNMVVQDELDQDQDIDGRSEAGDQDLDNSEEVEAMLDDGLGPRTDHLVEM